MIRRKAFLLAGALLAASGALQAQPADSILAAARAVVDSLCSPALAGRGYADEGHRKAADFLADRFAALGLRPAGSQGYLQPFGIRLNLIGDPLRLSLRPGKAELLPGRDFIAHAASGAGQGSAPVYDAAYGLDPSAQAEGRLLLFRDGLPPGSTEHPLKGLQARLEAWARLRPAAIVVLQEKLTASFDAEAFPLPVLLARREAWPEGARKADFEVHSRISSVQTQNVLGYVPGSQFPDTCLIVSAHYDHLGRQGAAIFRGANDNASGIALLLALAEYFSRHPQPYSLLFIAFGAEEAGLLGSAHYVMKDPRFPLAKTRFVLNLDLMGNGAEGIVAVGGVEHGPALEALSRLNERLKAVPVVKARKNAPNSDHYFFLREGRPGFFLYTLGGPPHYHDVLDTPEHLLLSHFLPLRTLLIAFLGQMQGIAEPSILHESE